MLGPGTHQRGQGSGHPAMEKLSRAAPQWRGLCHSSAVPPALTPACHHSGTCWGAPGDSQTHSGHRASMGCRDRESPRRHWGFLGPRRIPQIFSDLSLGSERQIPCFSHKHPLYNTSLWCIVFHWLVSMGAAWGAALL